MVTHVVGLRGSTRSRGGITRGGYRGRRNLAPLS